MESDGKRNDPPQWLKASDESWGQADMQKPLPILLPQSGLKLPTLPRLPRRARPLRLVQGKPSFKRSTGPMITVFLAFVPCWLLGFWLERLTGSDSMLVYMSGFFAGLFTEFFVIIGALRLIKMLKSH
jgi:hypothetical protein